MPFACVGLDWARPSSSPTLIALIKLLLRLRSHARIGVRAAGNKNQRAKRKRKRSKKISTSINEAYELATYHTRPLHLTPFIGVRSHLNSAMRKRRRKYFATC